MKSPNEQIDKLFSKGLSNYEELPSSTAWDTLENQLPKNQKHSYYWVAASVAMLFIVSAIVWNTILQKANPQIYVTSEHLVKANYPQKEFTSLPIIIHTTTIVYIEKEVVKTVTEKNIDISQTLVTSTEVKANIEMASLSNPLYLSTKIQSSFLSQPQELNTEFPITITYKKGDPRYPKLTNTLNFIKEVGEGERNLIDFEKITTGIIAKRETNYNSNN